MVRCSMMLAGALAVTGGQHSPIDELPFFQLTPVEVGTGPLLLVSERDSTTSEPWDLWQVVAPGRSLEPQRFLRVIGDVEPVARVGPHALVMMSRGQARGLVVIDLAMARCTPLGDFEPLDVQGGVVVAFAGDGEQERHLEGKKEGGARLVELPLAGGKSRRLVELPRGVTQTLLRARLSPGGRLLAWSYPWDLGEQKGASLVVVERATGRIVHQWNGIDVEVAPWSSSSATLEFVWLDEQRLRYSDTEPADRIDGGRRFEGKFRCIDVDVESGNVVATHLLGAMGLRHDVPSREPDPVPAAPRSPKGLFEVGDGKLWFLGDTEPIVDVAAPLAVTCPSFALSPDGRFALLQRDRELIHEVVLIHGGTRQRSPIGGPATRVHGWWATGE